MNDLKPCPFCGAEHSIVHLSREREEGETSWQYQVVCDYNFGGCGGSSGFDDDPKDAMKNWNRRTGDVNDAQRSD